MESIQLDNQKSDKDRPELLKYTDFITKVGFPIAAASYLLYVLTVFVNDTRKEINEVSKALILHINTTDQNTRINTKIEMVLRSICVNASSGKTEQDRCFE